MTNSHSNSVSGSSSANAHSSYPYTISGTHLTSAFPMQLTPGERRLIFSLEKIFDPQFILADCYFPKPDSLQKTLTGRERLLTNSDLAQIDCIAINASGIFVFESKDYSGYIYGHGDRKDWTQVLNFGREKHQFYNPVRQNQAHLDAIAAIVGDQTPLHSIIVFSRDATLKVLENIPLQHHVCTQASVRRTIATISTNLSKHTQLTPTQITTILDQLNSNRINPTAITRTLHVDEAIRASKTSQSRSNHQNP